MNVYGCSVAERLLSTTVRMNDTIIQISPYVRKPSSSRVPAKPTSRPGEAWPELPVNVGGRTRQSKPQSQSVPPSQRRRPCRHVESMHDLKQLVPSSSASPTSRTADEKPHQCRRESGDGPRRPTESVRSREDDSAGRAVSYPPPTITVRGRSPPRRGQVSDADSAACADQRTDVQIRREDKSDARLPLRESPARGVDDGERRVDVVRVYERLQTQGDTATEPIPASAPFMPGQQAARTSPTGVIYNDPDVTVNVPVTGSRKASVTIPKLARTSPLASDDGDVPATKNQALEEVSLFDVSEEKLKLLEKLVAGRRLTLGGAEVTVEVRQKLVRIGGDADQIRVAKTNVLESLSRMCCGRACVSETQSQLLVSDRGRRWLGDLLAKNGDPIMVLYATGAIGHIAGVDADVVSQVKSALKKSLATDAISFGPELSEFLQSGQWKEAVQRYESTWFLCVTVDDAAKKVVLDGCTRAVKDVSVEVRELLRQNSRVNRKIQLNSAEYRLVRQHLKGEISHCLKNQRG